MYSQLAYQWGGLGQLITFPQICSFYKGYSNVFSIKCFTSFQSFNIQVLIKSKCLCWQGVSFCSVSNSTQQTSSTIFTYFSIHFSNILRAFTPVSGLSIVLSIMLMMVVQLQDEILYHIIKSRGKIEAARTNRQPSSPTLHRKLSLVRDQSEKCVLVHLKGSFLISGGRKWVPYISE